MERRTLNQEQYLILGGAPKSTSTSLFRYLSDHPQICAANRKETYFFAREFDVKKVCQKEFNLAAFQSYFSHCKAGTTWRFEATPYTLYAGAAAEDIRNLLPQTKFLFIFRDPVNRLFSDYRMHVKQRHPHAQGSFEEFIDLQLKISSTRPKPIELGRYSHYLKAFFQIFGGQQIKILFFEELVTRTREEMSRICQFLRISESFYTNFPFKAHNENLQLSSGLLNQAIVALELWRATIRSNLVQFPSIQRLFEATLLSSKRLLGTINGPQPDRVAQLLPGSRARLEEYYRASNGELASLLDRPLPWSV